ncbi:hypothetical protein FZC66_19705 [Priestia megaterium]|nr:hypothetical protein FZC66_19705 [Priestia megaterium]
MDLFFLVVAVLTLLVALKRITAIEKAHTNSIPKEIKHNIFMMFWGILLVSCIVFAPYQVWVLTGASNDWDGVYMIEASLIATLFICVTFYSKFKVKKKII